MALLEITGNSELTDIEFELFTTEKILVVQLWESEILYLKVAFLRSPNLQAAA